MNRKLYFCLLAVVLLVGISRITARTETPKSVIPFVNVDGSELTNAHIVVGSVVVPPGTIPDPNSRSVPEGIPVTLAGAAGFSSPDSYKCFVSELAGVSPPTGMFRKIDGNHFAVRVVSNSAVSWRQDFVCVGN